MAEHKGGKPYEARRAHFIERAQALWGDTFDYTDMQYTTGKEPCIITCKKHGPFRVGMAQNHILKSARFRTGCPYCTEERSRLANQRLHQERRAREKAEREARQAEQEALREAKRQLEELKRMAIRKYVALHGYDVEQLTWAQICQLNASLHSKEKLAPIRLQRANEELQRRKEAARKREDREAERIRQRTADLIAKAKAVHGDKYDYSQTYYEMRGEKGNRFGYLCNIRCPVHGPFDTRADVHVTQGCGCANCARVLNKMSAEERKELWLAKCRDRYPGRYSYRQVVYINNDTPVKIYCKEHHITFECSPDTHARGSGGCPFCTKSKGEVHIYKWLTDHNVTFTTQYKLPNNNPDLDLQYLVADFWLPDYNLFIEMNGEQHYMDIDYFKIRRNRNGTVREKQWSLQLQQLRDQTMRQYCQDHNHHLLEIRYDQIGKIPQILTRELKKHI